ncbi:hypothetical protein FJZ21_02740 [Candidatus Pacearchaeota archaeon]|nr:hypothetical protein [Candidatus Pacearchaeota archaeon]
MRRTALIIGILGLGILVAFLLTDGLEVQNLDGLNVGEIVSIRGLVEQERKFGTGKLLIVNEIPVFCECENDYLGKNVAVEGIVERFPEDLRLRAFIIEVLD